MSMTQERKEKTICDCCGWLIVMGMCRCPKYGGDGMDCKLKEFLCSHSPTTREQIEEILVKDGFGKPLSALEDIMEVISSHYIPRERVEEEIKKVRSDYPKSDTQSSHDDAIRGVEHAERTIKEALSHALLEDNKE